MRHLNWAIICLLTAVLAVLPVSVHAVQQLEKVVVERPPIADDQLAVFVFDIRLGSLVDALESRGFSDEMILAMESPVAGVEDSRLIRRIYGAFCPPTDLQQLMQMEDGDAPFSYFVRFEFADKATCDLAERNLKRFYERILVIDGREYIDLRDSAFDAPGLVYRRLSDTLVEAGSLNYVASEDRGFYTPAALEAFRNASPGDVRFGVDLETCEPILRQAVDMVREEVIREFDGSIDVGSLLDLYDNGRAMFGSLGLKDQELVSITVVCDAENSAAEILVALKELLEFAKQVDENTLGMTMARSMLQPAAKVYAELTNGTTVERNEATVALTIPRPASLEDAVAEFNRARERESIRREQRMREVQLRETAKAVMKFESGNRVLPFEYTGEDILGVVEARIPPDINQDLSWRAKIVHHLDFNMVNQRRREQEFAVVPIDITKGPDEEPNSSYVDRMPAQYSMEIAYADAELNNTTMAEVVWVKPDNPVKEIQDINDGPENTIMLIQYPAGKPWLVHDPISIEEAVELVMGLEQGEGLAVAFYDGSTATITSGAERDLVRQLFDPADDIESAAQVRRTVFGDEH